MRRMWPVLSKAFEHFRGWSSFKTLLELLGIWKWVGLGGEIVLGFTVAWFSQLDWGWRFLIVLISAGFLLVISTLVVAIRQDSTRPGQQELPTDSTADSTADAKVEKETIPTTRPRKYQVVVAIVLLCLAIVCIARRADSKFQRCDGSFSVGQLVDVRRLDRARNRRMAKSSGITGRHSDPSP